MVSLLHNQDWRIRIFDFPRLQLIGLGFVPVLMWLAAGYPITPFSQFVFILLGLSLLYQAYTISPYTPLVPRQVVDAEGVYSESTLSLMICNVYIRNQQVKQFLEVVRQVDPDVLLVLEPDTWWEQQLAVLDEKYSYVLKQPQENTYGIILYSRLRLEEPRIRYLIEDDVPSILTGLELPSGEVVDFYGLHPRPPQPGSNAEERDAELLVVGREITDSDRPSVVAGDLNDVAWSHTTKLFQDISGLLDPRIGRGMYNTYHAHIPLLRYSLDHIFFSQEFELVELKRLPDVGSDHFPMYSKLFLSSTASQKQEEPTADDAEEREATDKIEKGIRAAN